MEIGQQEAGGVQRSLLRELFFCLQLNRLAPILHAIL